MNDHDEDPPFEWWNKRCGIAFLTSVTCFTIVAVCLGVAP